MPRLVVACCRHAWLVCVCIGVVALTVASAAVPTAAGRPALWETPALKRDGCRFAHATPGTASARRLGAALTCLVKRERRRHHLGRLKHAPPLDRLARRFAEDMRNRGYFGHVSPEGYGLSDRRRSVDVRALGEVLAWGCGDLSTPAVTMRAWLSSPPHRRVVLSRAYTLIGAGVADGAPGRTCGRAASTSVAILGRR